MKTALTLVITLALSACGSVPQKAPEPVIDSASIPQEKMVEYKANLKACKGIQEKAMPVSFLELFGSSDVKRDERLRAEKASMIVRECLKGRGFAVLY